MFKRLTFSKARVFLFLKAARPHLFGSSFALLIAAAPLALAQTDQPVRTQADKMTLENLRAFAKLYGYVRYFHPSDEASAVDWERFAIYGVDQVKDAASREELKGELEALFGPIAPTMQLYAANEPLPVRHALLTPEDTTGLALVAWQHRGVGLGNPGPYQSARLHRQVEMPTEQNFGAIGQQVDATSYRGKEVRLQAAVKAEVRGDENQAQLWLRVDRPNQEVGFFDNMQDRPITAASWETHTVTGTVAEDAERIVFGGFLSGTGKAWFDDIRLQVRGRGESAWTSVPLENAGFEADEPGEPPTGWGADAPAYRFLTSAGDAYAGKNALVVLSELRQTVGPLFNKRPEPGEVVEKLLGRGLMAQVPLALYSRDGQILRPNDAPPINRLVAELQATKIDIDDPTTADEALRYANIVIAWNVFQHFYPYFDVVDVDWDVVLTETLHRAEDDRTSRDFLDTLRWLVAQLDDGHGFVWHPLMEQEAGLPFLVDEVEGKAIIVATADEAKGKACFSRGDVVTSLDGVPARQALHEAEAYISGSPQWRTQRALLEFGRGERGSQARLTLMRAGETVTCEVTRDFNDAIQEARPEPIEELRKGVYYVDLSRAELSAITERAQALAAAQGVIFDLRGYPNSNHSVLQHLTSDTLRSARWQVPQQIYPDQKDLVGYDTSGRWTLTPQEPRFRGEIAFLTDAHAISYAESVMGIVEHYRLGEIVGQPTAGANGNVNPFTLPGGYSVQWTGMRVVKHDASQHHLIGVRPTVLVERTLKGVSTGRDEELEKALEVIEQSTSPDQ